MPEQKHEVELATREDEKLVKLILPRQRLAALAIVVVVQGVYLAVSEVRNVHGTAVCIAVVAAVVVIIVVDAWTQIKTLRAGAQNLVPYATPTPPEALQLSEREMAPPVDPNGTAPGLEEADIAPVSSRRPVPSLPPPAADVALIYTFRRILDQKVRLTTPLSEVIRKNINLLASGLDHLVRARRGREYVPMKRTLRHYFEYTGDYDRGVQFGATDLAATDAVVGGHERLWTRVKYIGYLSILAGHYHDARGELRSCANELASIEADFRARGENLPQPLVRLRFYIHRYLGIAWLRDEVASESERFEKAREQFEMARSTLGRVASEDERGKLEARVIRNLGNVAMEAGEHETAISLLEQSLVRFETTDDREHLGIAYLQFAKALIRSGDYGGRALRALKRADTHLTELGWVEGKGRLAEQRAALEVLLAENSDDIREKREHLSKARDWAIQSASEFKLIGHRPGQARITALLARIKESDEVLEHRLLN